MQARCAGRGALLIEYALWRMMMEIQTELEDLSSVKKRLTVSIPAETALREFDRVAKSLRSRVRVPGFRAGKAPVELVKRRYIANIRDEVVRKLVPASCEQALQEKEITPLRQPTVNPVDYREGGPLEYVAEFEVLPEVRLGRYKGLEVAAPLTEVSDEQLNQHLQKLREANSRLEPVEDRTIDLDDFAVVNLKGEFIVEEGTPPANAFHREDMVVEVGGEKAHKALTRALVGMNIAEEKEFEVEYEPDYPDPKLAGRKMRYTVEVTDVKRRVLPELNDELARSVGKYESLDELKSALRGQLQSQNEQRRDSEVENRLMEKLIAATGFEVPEALVEEQLDRRMGDVAGQIAAQGANPMHVNLDWRKLRRDLRPQAERRVRIDLILEEIVREEGLEASEEEIEQAMQRIAQSSDQAIERVRQNFNDARQMAGLKAQLRRQKALDLVVENARID